MKEITLINDDWCFLKGHSEIPSVVPNDADRVSLPHTWNSEDGTDGGNDYFRGSCVYVRRLSLSELPRAQKYYIEFKGANAKAEVFLNGHKISEHSGGYSTFRANMTEYIKGENILAVRVDNSHDDAVYPAMADFTFYGGLYRDVSVISLHNTHFELDCYGSDGIKVTPRITSGNCAEVDVEVFVTGASASDTLIYRITDKEGRCVAEDSTPTDRNRLTFEIRNPHLWQGVDDPYLYSATVTLMSQREIVDSVRVRFGIRSFEVDSERGFILNGREYALHGVSRHQDRLGFGNALLPEHHDEDIDLIWELGANTVRLAHYQHDRYFYDLCDERGLVVWAEIPYISRHSSAANENSVSQMKELILQNYNHPSICFWGLSNEITMGGGDDDDLIENHKRLNKLAHELDSTRLTGIACVSMCDTSHPYIKIPDVVGYNHYFGWYGGNTDMNGTWFDKFHSEHPTVPICITEYGAEALDWHTSEPRQGDYTEEYQAFYHEELIKQLFSRKYIFATFVWNMFDFGADARAEGGENGQNHKGLVTFDRSYKKDAFYAYKANLSREPFVHIAGKRYRERAEDTTTVTVYSNADEVELFLDGRSFGKKKDAHGFFKFEIPLSAKTVVEARAGKLVDTAQFVRVERFNEKYRLKEAGAVLNWFDVSAPDGYFSLNDEIGEVLKTKKGAELFEELSTKMTSKIEGNMKLDEKMLEMLSGFTVLRFVNTLGSMSGEVTKEELLALNEKLNKIKKTP